MRSLQARLAEIQKTWKTPEHHRAENPLADLCSEHLRLNRRSVIVAQSDLTVFKQSLAQAREVTRWILDGMTPMPFHEVCRVLDLDCGGVREQLTKNIEPGLVGLMSLAVQYQCPVCGAKQ